MQPVAVKKGATEKGLTVKEDPISTNNKNDQSVVETEASVEKPISAEDTKKNIKNIEQPTFIQEENDNTSQKTVQSNESTCSISVKCTSILNNIEQLDKEKRDIIPQNGIIFENKTPFFMKTKAFSMFFQGN